MTDKAHAGAERAATKHPSKFRRYAVWVAQVLVIILLLDGFMDLTYPAVRKAILSQKRPAWAGYRRRELPGLGIQIEPIGSEDLNVGAFGRRSTGNVRKSPVRGVLLGSSQAFGWSVPDDATLGAALERQRPDVTVVVLAGPARTVAESMASWRWAATNIDAPDFGILLFSNVELYEACQPKLPDNSGPALISIPARLLRRFSIVRPKLPCSTPEGRSAIVERAIYDVRSAVAYHRMQNSHFMVFIPPLLYGNNSNAASLRSQFDAELMGSLDKAVREFRRKVTSEHIPEVVDLSDSFDGRGDDYFLDTGSHFNRAGANIIASDIIKNIPKGFFEER